MINTDLSPSERMFLLQLRSLLLKAVVMIEQRLGRSANHKFIPIQCSRSDSLAGAVSVGATTSTVE